MNIDRYGLMAVAMISLVSLMSLSDLTTIAGAAEPDRDQVRIAARNRARQQWFAARRNVVAKEAAVRRRRSAARRWHDEARMRDIERWKRAAKRSGTLDNNPASGTNHTVPTGRAIPGSP